MTGIAMVMAAGASSGVIPPPALSCSVSFSGGQGPFNVAGPSGDLYTQAGAVISVSFSGGTGPFTESISVQGDASGKLSIVAASDHVHNTIGYSGFNLNETQGCYLDYEVSDSVGNNASARYPVVGQIIAVKRTS